jgi:hypothetical protein
MFMSDMDGVACGCVVLCCAVLCHAVPACRYEVLAMLQHSNHLEAEYGAGPHTISVPRLRPADGSELSIRPPYEVSHRHRFFGCCHPLPPQR